MTQMNDTYKVDYESWYKRWLALDAAMMQLQQYIDYKLEAQDTSLRKETFQSLIAGLRQFVGGTNGLFNFIRMGMESGGWNPGADYPPDYVFRHLLEQAGYDLDIISTAAAQRYYAGPDLKKRFAQADKLAAHALQPAKDIGLIKAETTAVTYFATRARARVITYAPVALIAIPFTAGLLDQDLLATAHEAGHYVYWHGLFAEKAPWKTITEKGIAPWCVQWLEEIFADVYGVLVAGVPVARSCQDLLLTKAPSDFWENDGEHPVDSIRPLIYTKVLAEMGKEQEKWAGALRSHWRGCKIFLGSDPFATSLKKKQGVGDVPTDPTVATIAEAIDLNVLNWSDSQPGGGVDQIIRHLLESPDGVLYPLLQAAQNTPGWMHEVAYPITGLSVEQREPYSQFTQYLAMLTEAQNRSEDISAGELDALRTKAHAQPEQMSAEEWQNLFTWGGWVTRGPQEQPNPPKP